MEEEEQQRQIEEEEEKKSYVGQSSRRPLFVWNIHQHAAIKEKEKTLGKTIFLRNFSSFYCRGFWAISRHSENKGVRCDLLPMVLQQGMQKKGSAINGVGLFSLSLLRPLRSDRWVDGQPIGLLLLSRPIARPTEPTGTLAEEAKNRLYWKVSKPSNLWTISLLFAVSNVAVFFNRACETSPPLEP